MEFQLAGVEADQGSSSFLNGSGEMGALIRAHDWSKTVLGPMADWPRSLRTILGTVLASPFPMVIAWGPELLTLYNDAYRPLLGDKLETLGQPFNQVWAEARDTIAPLLHRALAGEAFRTESAPFWLLRSGRPEKAYFDFSFSAIRDESGAIVGVLNTAIEVTAHILSERRQAFRLSLEHRLRDVTDPAEAMAVVSEALGRHLSVAQVAYAEVEPGGETVIIERDWHDGTMGSNRRRHRLDDYGPELIANLRSGETVAIPDVALDRRTWSPAALAAFAQARIVGLLDVPVLKGGQLAAILGVHSHTPHAWLGEEIALAQEVAERTWVAAEQASAQGTVRESEERYRTLFEAIDAGFCIVEVLFEGEQAIDYRFVEVHPAFRRQTGLRRSASGCASSRRGTKSTGSRSMAASHGPGSRPVSRMGRRRSAAGMTCMPSVSARLLSGVLPFCSISVSHAQLRWRISPVKRYSGYAPARSGIIRNARPASALMCPCSSFVRLSVHSTPFVRSGQAITAQTAMTRISVSRCSTLPPQRGSSTSSRRSSNRSNANGMALPPEGIVFNHQRSKYKTASADAHQINAEISCVAPGTRLR